MNEHELRIKIKLNTKKNQHRMYIEGLKQHKMYFKLNRNVQYD